MSKELVAGAWSLVSFHYQAEDGTTFYPYGREARGIIIYEPGGYMSATIVRSDRPLLSSQDYANLPDAEKITLSRGFLAYSGKYEVLPEKILHHVEISYFPNWTGTVLERFYSFENGDLVLSTPPETLRGKDFRAYLVWRKKQD